MFLRLLSVFWIVFQGLTDLSWSQSSSIVSVGAVLPLTGDFAFVGRELQRGMKLAQRDFPGVSITFEDDKSLQNLAAVSAVTKLTSVDKVDILLTASVDNVHSIAPQLERSQRPGIVIWDSAKEINDLNQYVFAAGFSTDFAGKDMATLASKDLKAKSAAVISAEGEWSERISEAFIEQFKRSGGEVSVRERINPVDSDFRSLITKIQQQNIDVIYLPLYYTSLTAFIRQARQLGFSKPILCGDGFTVDDLRILKDKMSANIFLTHVWLTDANFRKKYEEKFAKVESPIHLAYAGVGYDAIHLVNSKAKSLLARSEQVTPSSLRMELHKDTFTGLMGAVDFRTSRTAPKREPILKISDGKFQFFKFGDSIT